MYKITAKIDGMMCGMCEAHICDEIRRAFPNAKKVSASRKRAEAVFLSEEEIDETLIKKVIDATGYTLVGVITEPYRKRGLFK